MSGSRTLPLSVKRPPLCVDAWTTTRTFSHELITEAKLNKTLAVAHDLFGVETAIFTTVPFSNNIQTEQDYLKMNHVNRMIKKFCLTYRPHGNVRRIGVHSVMALDLHQLVHALMEENAVSLGYNTSVQQSDPVWYWMERLSQYPKHDLHASIPHVCAAPKPAMDAPSCHKQNSFSLDGMHYCMTTVAGRLVAGVACLLKCFYDTNYRNYRESSLHECASSCNQQFMSLHPIPKSVYSHVI